MTSLVAEQVQSAEGQVDDDGVGTALWFLAVLCVLASLLSRGITAALPGIWVGADHIITLSKLVGAFLSQLFAVWGWLMLVALALRVVRRDRLSTNLRGFAMGMVMIAFLSLAIGSGALALLIQWLSGRRVTQRLPTESGLVLLAGVALFAFSAVRAVAECQALRWARVYVGLLAFVAGCRGVAVAIADYALAQASQWVYLLSRLVASLGQAAFAVVVFAVWRNLAADKTATLSRKRLGVVLGVGLGLAALLWSAGGGDGSGSAVLLARLGEQYGLRPHPLLPSFLFSWLQLMAVLASMAILVWRPRGYFHAAMCALMLASQGAPDMPLGAIALLLVIYGLLLAEPQFFTPEARRRALK